MMLEHLQFYMPRDFQFELTVLFLVFFLCFGLVGLSVSGAPRPVEHLFRVVISSPPVNSAYLEPDVATTDKTVPDLADAKARNNKFSMSRGLKLVSLYGIKLKKIELGL